MDISLAVLVAQHNDVTVLDIDPDRADQLNRRESVVAYPDNDTLVDDIDFNPKLQSISVSEVFLIGLGARKYEMARKKLIELSCRKCALLYRCNFG